jgi:hypothetical protein
MPPVIPIAPSPDPFTSRLAEMHQARATSAARRQQLEEAGCTLEAAALAIVDMGGDPYALLDTVDGLKTMARTVSTKTQSYAARATSFVKQHPVLVAAGAAGVAALIVALVKRKQVGTAWATLRDIISSKIMPGLVPPNKNAGGQFDYDYDYDASDDVRKVVDEFVGMIVRHIPRDVFSELLAVAMENDPTGLITNVLQGLQASPFVGAEVVFGATNPAAAVAAAVQKAPTVAQQPVGISPVPTFQVAPAAQDPSKATQVAGYVNTALGVIDALKGIFADGGEMDPDMSAANADLTPANADGASFHRAR